MTTLKLGLIGNGISKSSAKRLHTLAGHLCGIDVDYEPIDLKGHDPSHFEAVFGQCARDGYHGINVTHPYKERAARMVQINDPLIQHMGAVNTVLFNGGKHICGFNTDNSGFVRAFRHQFGNQPAGVTALVGTGGAGRAVAFGLVELGSRDIRLYDLDRVKAEALAQALRLAAPDVTVRVCHELAETLAGADGLLNCTQVGMYQYPGTPIPAELIGGQTWAFDAIYTPLETEFLAAARARGLAILSGYELFFYQGINAFEIFTGVQLEEQKLRDGLATFG